MLKSALSKDVATKPVTTTSVARQFIVSAAKQDFDVIRYFVERVGIHPDTTTDGKPTALCYAALHGDRCMMQYLVIHGADVNQSDKMGMTPMHYVALGGCAWCVSYLVKSNCDINSANRNEITPLGLINDCPYLRETADLLRRYGAAIAPSTPHPTRFH